MGEHVLTLSEDASHQEAGGYECTYLESTCTFGQIAGAQIYRNKNTDTEIYTTYRSMNEMQLLYVVNASTKRGYEQTFDFGRRVNSFLKLDLMELTTEQVPLTIKLGPGEDAILLPYARKMEE